MMFSKSESRGASLNLEYILALGATVALLTGTTVAISGTLDYRETKAQNEEMEIIAEKTYTTLLKMNNEKGDLESGDRLELFVSVPSEIDRGSYTVILSEESGDGKLVVESNQDGYQIEKTLPDNVNVRDGTGAPARNIGLEYSGTDNQFSLTRFN